MDNPTLAHGYRIDTDGSVLVPLRGKHGVGRLARIDADDYPEVSRWRWYANRNGYSYGQRHGPRRVRMQVLLHHLVFDTPYGTIVDHVNGDRLDATKANLRVVSYSVNNRNRVRVKKVGFKGAFAVGGGLWQARIKWDERNWNLGSYATAEDAARVYDAAALHIDPDLGSHALNFPDEAQAKHPAQIRREAFAEGHITSKSSPYRGVSWKPPNSAFQAFFTEGHRTVYLGLHDDEEQAARAHDSYALHALGPSAPTNFPDGAAKSREEIMATVTAIRAARPALRRTRTTNQSGYQGLKFHGRRVRKNWQAMIQLAGTRKSLGYFMTPEEAAQAYDAACVKAGLPPVNFP